MKKQKLWHYRLAFVLLIFVIIGAVRSMLKPVPSAVTAPDYADAAAWALRPVDDAALQAVDVFYLHPVLVATPDEPLMQWKDTAVRQKVVVYSTQQAGMFTGFANVYVPFVRQLEYGRAIIALQQTPPDYAAMIDGAEDARRAFRHYMEQWNDGRPFILFGHSEGAMDLYHVLVNELADPAVRGRFVAAYLIGMPITTAELAASPHLRLAQDEADTSVIISYNTEAPEADPSVFSVPGAACINPLNWRTDAAPADRSLNLGAVFFDYEGTSTAPVAELPAFCGAVVDPARGALIVELDEPAAYSAEKLMGKGVYHMNDIYFFYRNLAQNARTRATAFQAAQPSAVEIRTAAP